jgi:hypothetical protein
VNGVSPIRRSWAVRALGRPYAWLFSRTDPDGRSDRLQTVPLDVLCFGSRVGAGMRP